MSTAGHNHLRSLTDRILRLKDEQDSIGVDIREVYAEAKSSGFDKTALGRLVTHIRKRDKDSAKVQEDDALFNLYLDTYDAAASRTHAHAREANQESGNGDVAYSGRFEDTEGGNGAGRDADTGGDAAAPDKIASVMGGTPPEALAAPGESQNAGVPVDWPEVPAFLVREQGLELGEKLLSHLELATSERWFGLSPTLCRSLMVRDRALATK